MAQNMKRERTRGHHTAKLHGIFPISLSARSHLPINRWNNSHSVSPENASDEARVDHGEKEWVLVGIVAQIVVVDCEGWEK